MQKKNIRIWFKDTTLDLACYFKKLFGHNHFHSSWNKNPNVGSYKKRGNRVISKNAVYLNTDFYLSGNNNHIIISKESRIDNCKFIVQGNDNIICIGESTDIKDSILRCGGENSKISIGSKVYIGGAEVYSGNGCSVSIGDGCLLAHGIDIRNSEHPIYEMDSDIQLNVPMDIYIEENVWIGNNVIVLKGSRISSGSIIGEGAIVTHTHSADNKNSIYVGNPLRCIRENIRWKN